MFAVVIKSTTKRIARTPSFVELKSILAKTSGIRDILHEALASLKDRIKLAFVYGSIARGEEKASSDVDLMVVGEISFCGCGFRTG